VKYAPKLAVEGFCLIKPLLKDNDYDVRMYASGTLGKIVKADPKLAVEGLNLI
jgi:hypothetical protein